MDVTLAIFALVFLLPLLLVLAAAVYLQDGGPVLFAHRRIGFRGRPFYCLKFRSMALNAEAKLADLLANDPVARAEWAKSFKLKNDPRVTKLGLFLRRSSLDELPQLINVLIGDMSLVGPRPALPAEVAGYSGYMWRRLVVKPGMTGLWQVSGRSDVSWEEAERLDVHYVENWSLALDLQVLWKTGSAVIRGSGAY